MPKSGKNTYRTYVNRNAKCRKERTPIILADMRSSGGLVQICIAGTVLKNIFYNM
jgi:hypothetical protein